VVPTKSHFIPLFAIVIQGPQKSRSRRVNIANKFSTIDDVPKMAVKYMFIYINVANMTGYKIAKVGSKTVPNTEVLLCRFKEFYCAKIR
jgi:uncharacterized protein with von Willebrand factor type A (vWA) domain